MQAADQLRDEKDIVFAFIGGGGEFACVKKWAVGNPQVLCLPYQPLEKLSGSLSAAEAHLVVMGNAMLGLVHPCKIYNIFAVGAPVAYVGPRPSHATDIFDQHPDYPWVSVQHGEAAALAEHIRRMVAQSKDRPRGQPQQMLRSFSKATLVRRRGEGETSASISENQRSGSFSRASV